MGNYVVFIVQIDSASFLFMIGFNEFKFYLGSTPRNDTRTFWTYYKEHMQLWSYIIN